MIVIIMELELIFAIYCKSDIIFLETNADNIMCAICLQTSKKLANQI